MADEVNSKAVLVVDDEPNIRKLLIDCLQDEGIPVVGAADGETAIGIITTTTIPNAKICVILLDLMLPKRNGIDVINYLQSIDNTTPIIAMSASRKHLADAIMAGAHATIAKPFDVEEVLSAVSYYC